MRLPIDYDVIDDDMMIARLAYRLEPNLIDVFKVKGKPMRPVRMCLNIYNV